MHKKQFNRPRKSAEDFQYQPENQRTIDTAPTFKEYVDVDVKKQMPEPKQNAVEALCQKAHEGKCHTANRFENDDNYTRVTPIGKSHGFTLSDIPLDPNGKIANWTNVPLLLSNLYHPEIAKDRNGNLVIYERVRPHDDKKHDDKKREHGNA
jgi:hypothetical protein